MVKRLLMTFLLGWFAASPAAMAAAEPGEYFEGVQYQLVTPPQPTANPDKIEVLELFWYGCPHCYHFEPHVQKWLKTKPADVDFVRMPASFKPLWELHAKAYYTAEILGVLDKVHDAFFHARQEAKRQLATEDELADFFAAHGVDKATFHKTFNSFPVMLRVGQSKQVIPRYGVSGVPSVIVNGKYRVGAGMVDGYPEMIRVINYLVAKERAEKRATK